MLAVFLAFVGVAAGVVFAIAGNTEGLLLVAGFVFLSLLVYNGVELVVRFLPLL